jgi:hypothetical protein
MGKVLKFARRDRPMYVDPAFMWLAVGPYDPDLAWWWCG